MEEEAKTSENLDTSSENKPLRDEKGRLLKGHTANPAGRPKGTLSITSMIKKKLQEVPEGEQETYAQILIKTILDKAIVEQDTRMIKQIWEYMDGKPDQKLTINPEQAQKVQDTLNQINEMTKHEPQADTTDVSGGGQTSGDSAEVPATV